MSKEIIGPLGLPMTVISEEEQANLGPDAIYVMMRVADDDPTLAWPALLKRRRKEPCERCGRLCWLDPLSYGRTPAHVPRICVPCLPDFEKSRREIGS